MSRDEWKAAKERYAGAAEQKPSLAPALRAKALTSLRADKYTRILDPDGYAKIARFDILGVGLILSPGADGRAAVVSPPLPGSAAAKSGLVKRGDVVDTLDGVKTAGLSSFELLDVVDRAPNKNEATLGVVSPGDDAAPRMITLARATREVADPLGRVDVSGDGVGYVRLKEFNARTADRLAEALSDLETRGASRYVLDLRGNPGGAFQEAVSAAALFVKDGAPVADPRGGPPGRSGLEHLGREQRSDDRSRRRCEARARSSELDRPRGRVAATPRRASWIVPRGRRLTAPPWVPRGYSVEAGSRPRRGDAARIFRGGRGAVVDQTRRRFTSRPRPARPRRQNSWRRPSRRTRPRRPVRATVTFAPPPPRS